MVVDRHVGTRFGKSRGNPGADAGAGAGHQRNAAAEVEEIPNGRRSSRHGRARVNGNSMWTAVWPGAVSSKTTSSPSGAG